MARLSWQEMFNPAEWREIQDEAAARYEENKIPKIVAPKQPEIRRSNRRPDPRELAIRSEIERLQLEDSYKKLRSRVPADVDLKSDIAVAYLKHMMDIETPPHVAYQQKKYNGGRHFVDFDKFREALGNTEETGWGQKILQGIGRGLNAAAEYMSRSKYLDDPKHVPFLREVAFTNPTIQKRDYDALSNWYTNFRNKDPEGFQQFFEEEHPLLIADETKLTPQELKQRISAQKKYADMPFFGNIAAQHDMLNSTLEQLLTGWGLWKSVAGAWKAAEAVGSLFTRFAPASAVAKTAGGASLELGTGLGLDILTAEDTWDFITNPYQLPKLRGVPLSEKEKAKKAYDTTLLSDVAGTQIPTTTEWAEEPHPAYELAVGLQNVMDHAAGRPLR